MHENLVVANVRHPGHLAGTDSIQRVEVGGIRDLPLNVRGAGAPETVTVTANHIEAQTPADAEETAAGRSRNKDVPPPLFQAHVKLEHIGTNPNNLSGRDNSTSERRR